MSTRLVAGLCLAAAPLVAGCATRAAPEMFSAPSSTSAATPGAEDVESTTFARTLVVTCARVREDEMMLVSGAPKDARLLEDIATEVRRVGAHALVWIDSDRLRRRSFVDVPARFDGERPAWRLHLAAAADVEIVVDGSENEALLADVPADRVAVRERAGVAVTRKLMERGVRQIYVGNDLRPTADRAKRYGTTEEALARVYRAGLDVDYDALASQGAEVVKALGGVPKSRGPGRPATTRTMPEAVQMHLTAANGTDLRFDVRRNAAYASDGIVSAADERRGGAALQTWLPAGEAFAAAMPGTAEGRIVVDRDTWDGGSYSRLVLTFHGGRLESMEAESGGGRLAAAYAAAGAGKDVFGGIDIGFNPALVAPAGSSMRSFAVAGNVTFAFGANTWLGGDNACDFGFTASLPDATLEAGGTEIVRRGELIHRGSMR